MVKNQEEDLALCEVKKQNEIELLRIKEELAEKEHRRKLERLNIQLEIAKATGTSIIEEDDKNLLSE